MPSGIVQAAAHNNMHVLPTASFCRGSLQPLDGFRESFDQVIKLIVCTTDHDTMGVINVRIT